MRIRNPVIVISPSIRGALMNVPVLLFFLKVYSFALKSDIFRITISFILYNAWTNHGWLQFQYSLISLYRPAVVCSIIFFNMNYRNIV